MSYTGRQSTIYQGPNSQHLSFAARYPRLYTLLIIPVLLTALFVGLGCGEIGGRNYNPLNIPKAGATAQAEVTATAEAKEIKTRTSENYVEEQYKQLGLATPTPK